MDRRVFLKTAVTACGVVVVGIPGIGLSTGRIKQRPGEAKELRFRGDRRHGCTVPTYAGNQHDAFPQDLNRMFRT